MVDEMSPERLFSLYALPALEDCGSKLSEEEKSGLLDLVISGGAPSKESLETLFPKAFLRMRSNLGENFWNLKGVKEYWFTIHNKIVPKDCQVKFLEITGYEGSNHLIEVKSQNEPELHYAMNLFRYQLKPGDYITCHKGRIAQLISEDEFIKYAK